MVVSAGDCRIDSAGRRRRLCDAPCSGEDGGSPRGRRCIHYATRRLVDGSFRCATHDPDRKGSWLLCSQPVAWDEHTGAPTKTCAHRGRWLADGGKRWYCKLHDPLRARCANARAHPFDPATLPAAWAGISWFGISGMQDPQTPTAVRRYVGLVLCATCVQRHVVVAHDRAEAAKKPPCSLCHDSRVLEDDHGRRAPCLCTPDGLIYANAGQMIYAPPTGPRVHRGRPRTAR